MKPSIGRIIIVRCPQAQSNGSDIAPAVITRVWDEGDTDDGPIFVDVTAFPDCGVPVVASSVSLYRDRAHADASGNPIYSAWWPERA